MKLNKILSATALLLLMQNMAHAAIQLELNQGMSGAIPIGVVAFGGDPNNTSSPNNITSVVNNDLKNSGRFKLFPSGDMKQTPTDAASVDYNYWKSTAVDDVVVGNIKSLGGDNYQVSFSLLDVYKGLTQKENNTDPVLLSDTFTIKAAQFRQLAHKISDEIYQQLTGDRGVFSTKITYVLKQETANQRYRYLLEVADADGYNPRPILISNDPIMSPTWSPDGKQIAYVSYEQERASIFISDIATGKRQLVSSAPGMNNAPAFSPDGTKLALVRSTTGAPKIYVMDLATHNLTQVTTGTADDTEPSYTADGKSIVFTSNRGGGPQLYRLSLADSNVDRVTFDGNYNATGSFTPDGNQIALLHQNGNAYNIAVQDITSGALTELTQSSDDSSPSMAPNGKMILFASNADQHGVLGIVSIDGSVKITLPAPEGSAREPAWSPFLG